jgi:carbon monoxide dehydrogenase subunit G
MAKVERSILMNVPSEKIEEITLDGSRLAEWFAGVESAEPDDVFPNPGGKLVTTYKSGGVKFELTQTALERVEGQSATYQMEGMITGTNHWVYTPEGEGTLVTATFDYEMPGGVLGKVADKLVVERMNIENLEKSLENLKKLAES